MPTSGLSGRRFSGCSVGFGLVQEKCCVERCCIVERDHRKMQQASKMKCCLARTIIFCGDCTSRAGACSTYIRDSIWISLRQPFNGVRNKNLPPHFDAPKVAMQLLLVGSTTKSWLKLPRSEVSLYRKVAVSQALESKSD